jgi:CubicO group peptidase (beta-lactamase class C family)
MRRLRPSLLLVCAILLFSFSAGTRSQEQAWPLDDWSLATPESQGMDSWRLVGLLDTILATPEAQVDSVLIVRNGHIVLEAYGPPYDAGTTHILHSVSKSFISTLIGIAIDQGLIESTDVPVASFFPDTDPASLTDGKADMTLGHLLTMTSGLRCNGTAEADSLFMADDWVSAILALDMRMAPGERFEYCNYATVLLSAILTQVTGMPALDYANEVLFGPLGIQPPIWPATPLGITIGAGELRLTPRDMARFGLLILRDGQWAGRQIVSPAWVETATSAQVRTWEQPPWYGYQWWIDDEGRAAAVGYRGQTIIVDPEHDLVVVFTANRVLSSLDGWAYEAFSDHILPAVRSDAPLDANPTATEQLLVRIERLRPRPQLVQPLPATAAALDGVTYACPGWWQELTLAFDQGSATASLSGVTPDGMPTGEVLVGLDGIARYTRLEALAQDFWVKGYWEDDGGFVVRYLARGDGPREGDLLPFWARLTPQGDGLAYGTGRGVPRDIVTTTCTRATE